VVRNYLRVGMACIRIVWKSYEPGTAKAGAVKSVAIGTKFQID
jgi:hypothetical protein